jgi:hypothetical protein
MEHKHGRERVMVTGRAGLAARFVLYRMSQPLHGSSGNIGIDRRPQFEQTTPAVSYSFA